MMRCLLAFAATVLLLLAQAAFTSAWAQDMGASSGSGTGGYGGTAPAAAGGASDQGTGATQAPVAIPQVQTPSITNLPSAGQVQNLPAGIRQQLQQSLPRGPNRQVPRQQTTQQSGTETVSTRQRNEFQDFIAQSTGQQLPLYGYDLFRGTPSTFAPVENIPVPSDYVIGPGDQLIIRAWGQIDVNYRVTVDRNGMIEIPQVGPVEVAGIPYRNLTDVVRTAVSRNFRNFQLLVTMGQLRSIQIYVVGHARRSGSYTVSSLSTLMNAVFAAGGPSGHGTMRDIELKRGDKVVARLDLYDLLLRGDKSQDAPLLPGDVIYFPPIGSLVALSGSVNTPAIYELRNETTLGELIKMAGGLTATAQTKRASIERIENRQARISEIFSLDAKGLAQPVQNGDLVSIYSISPKFEDVVTLRGHVASPLRYPYHPGMRIDDLIPSKDALITPNYYLRQNLAVRQDVVTQGGLSASVRQLADEINWNYAVIERLNKSDLTTQLIPFNLGKAVLEHDPANNLPLMPGDVVTVFSKTDVRAPAEQRPIVVSLEGEVRHAGVYQAKPGETLRQLVARVGGVTRDAYLYGADFTRESVRRDQEERLKRVITEMQQDLESAAAGRAANAAGTEDVAAAQQQTQAQRALIARLADVKPTGRIVLDLPRKATVADLPDIALEDGDTLRIPQRPSMVSVFGTVFNQSSYLYDPDKTVGDYLKQAGGPRKDADKSSIFVIKADGSVASNRESGWLVSSLDSTRLMPGDAIVVPQDFDRGSFMRGLKDWTQIIYQLGLGAAAIHVLGL